MNRSNSAAKWIAIAGRPLVVVAGGVDRVAVAEDGAVAVAGEGEEHGGPVGLAFRGGEHPPESAWDDLALG
jgi:hypothetical protein